MTAGGVADVAPGPRPAGERAFEPSEGAAAGTQAAAGDAGTGPSRRGDRAGRRWIVALLAICALGLGIRVAYTLNHDIDTPDEPIAGDAKYYHDAANLLADGEGFIHPYYWEDGRRVPGADHPPGYQVVLAVPSLFGFDSVRDHQLFSSLLGTATVFLVGIAGRQVAGRRTGLIAAFLAAVYPNVWMNDAAVMSETLALLCGVVVVIAAYACWRRPDTLRFALVGGAIGLATLARAEGFLLVPLLAWPLALWAVGLRGWRERVAQALVASFVAGAVLAPWVVPNLFRFEQPTTLSTQLGPTLDVANCPPTYSGQALGSWSFECAIDTDAEIKANPDFDLADRSTLDKYHREKAIDYARDHADRLPAVVAARFGRAWGLYVPGAQLKFDRYAENRPMWSSQVGLGMYYVLAAASVAGVVVLRRRRVPSFPLVAQLVNVAVTVVAFYGSTRFRAPAEPALVLLGAVAFDAVVRGLRGEPDPPGPNPPGPPAEAAAAPSAAPSAALSAPAGPGGPVTGEPAAGEPGAPGPEAVRPAPVPGT